jgi:hypothetical protein
MRFSAQSKKGRGRAPKNESSVAFEKSFVNEVLFSAIELYMHEIRRGKRISGTLPLPSI